MKNIKVILAGTILGAVAMMGVQLTTTRTYMGEKVWKVVDGDTFILENKQAIRLYGVDAPELGNCFAKESTEKLEKLVLGKRVWLTDPMVAGSRIMALVYVGGKLVNEEMLKGGFAMSQYTGAEKELMKAANEKARIEGLGIYGKDCYQKEPPDKKCAIKGNVSEYGGKKAYLLPGCRNYDQTVVERYLGEKWFCSEAEARREGFVKSGTCE